MKKKIFKIIGVILLLIIGLLIAAPFILEAKFGELLKTNVNNSVNATLDFTEADLSLIKNFPNASLNLLNVSLTNMAPFEGDTLFAAKEINMTLSIGQLLNSESEPIAINNLNVDGADIHVKVNENEVANYEIAKEDSTSKTKTGASESFSLDLQSYDIINSNVVYDDLATKVFLELSEIQHSGNGDFSAVTSELETYTEALVTFVLDSTKYLHKNRIKLDALIGVDLKNDKYAFLRNEAMINQLPLIFKGFIKVNEKNQEIDLSFKTPSSDFKNFLAVIPEEYAKNISDVQTEGDFVLEGKFNGTVDETHIPRFNININSDNASFKYPDLPKSVRNVFIDTKIINSTGISEDTYVEIDKLSFMIDEDKFNMVAKIKELMGNTKVNAHVDANMNLTNIEKAYPIPADLDLKGLLKADISTSFDMVSIEKKQYENTNTKGTMSLKGFEYNSPEMAKTVKLSTTALTFNPKTVTLNKLKGSTGRTDFNATGTINNLLGFLFNDEKVEGNFIFSSNTFALNDFMVAEEIETVENDSNGQISQASEEKIKIPSFLDANINVMANTVIYDNIILNDVKGNLRVKDEKATLTKMTSSLFNGKMGFTGSVSTKNEAPSFAMNLDMKNFNIQETFKSLELFETLAPLLGALRGTLDSEIEISGSLNDNFTPDLSSISGNVLAHLLRSELDPKKAEFLKKINEKLNFLKPENLNLKGLKSNLSFENGKVTVNPFSFNYGDIIVNVNGSHTFDKKMDYKASMNVPVKHLGDQVNTLIAKIDDSSLDDLTIPVRATIGGYYDSPIVTTDLTSGVSSLTTKLVEIQKQKLINNGKDRAKNLLGDVLGQNKTSENNNSIEDLNEEEVKEVLGRTVEGTHEKDSVTTKIDSIPEKKKEEDIVKEKAKDILGGLFGGTNKRDDSMN